MARISPCSLVCWASREEREGESRERREEWQGAREPQEDTSSRSGGGDLREDSRLERWQGDRDNMLGTGRVNVAFTGQLALSPRKQVESWALLLPGP